MTTGKIGRTNHDRKRITRDNCASTQKAGFRVPKTLLWLINVWFSASTFVVKIINFV
jgi:hypothetical protein